MTYEIGERGGGGLSLEKTMLGTSPPTNWSQISKEIPLSFVIMSYKEWDSGEGRSEEKGGGSQISITRFNLGLWC